MESRVPKKRKETAKKVQVKLYSVTKKEPSLHDDDRCLKALMHFTSALVILGDLYLKRFTLKSVVEL